MSRKKGTKTIDDLRHNEYYGMQKVFAKEHTLTLEYVENYLDV